MSKYQGFRILSLIILFGLIIANYKSGLSLWWLLPFFLFYVSVIAAGSYFIRWNFFMKSISKGPGEEARLSITFDDGPHPRHTPEVLSVLDQYGVKATFFLIGKNAEAQEGLVKEIISRGHLIGSHSWAHSYTYDLLPANKVEDDLLRVEKILQEMSGKKIRFFRPPYGVTNPQIARVVKNLGYLSIGWNKRSMDTTKASDEQVLKNVHEQPEGDDIVLFHDSMERTARILPLFLELCREKGIHIVPLDELINEKPYV